MARRPLRKRDLDPELPILPIPQVKVRLLDVSPMVWGRLLIPAATTLRELDGVLQVAMGWEGVHLYVFEARARRYGSPELCTGNPDVPLADLRLRIGTIDAIPHYGERRRYGEPISTAFVESAINVVIDKRMSKRQQMQWTKRGAHHLLQARTRTLDGTLRPVFESWYPGLAANDHISAEQIAA